MLLLHIPSRLFYHDYYTDPLGWDHDDDITTTTTTGASHTSKRCLHGLTVQSCVGDVEGVRSVEDVRSVDDVRGVVVFDCLSMLLLTQSASSVSRLLHGLGKSWVSRLWTVSPLLLCRSSLLVSVITGSCRPARGSCDLSAQSCDLHSRLNANTTPSYRLPLLCIP